jgi:caa(3)-type oxidase subunit IV
MMRQPLPWKRVLATTGVLLLLLVATLLLHREAPPGLSAVSGIGIALAKAALIGAFFMELARSGAVPRVFALAAPLWLLLMLAGTLADVLSRH